jgi:hypothetical protein
MGNAIGQTLSLAVGVALSPVAAFSPAKAAGAGAVLAGANPKNLLLAVGAAAAIAQTGFPAASKRSPTPYSS